jgi:hypothetical protein
MRWQNVLIPLTSFLSILSYAAQSLASGYIFDSYGVLILGILFAPLDGALGWVRAFYYQRHASPVHANVCRAAGQRTAGFWG